MSSDDEIVTEHQAKSDDDGPHPRSFRLVVIEGADRGASSVVEETAAAPLLIGTASGCQLVLTDRLVSRRHASFECDNGKLCVRDLRSMNGTHLHGMVVREALLDVGHVVRVGETAIRVDAFESATKEKLPHANHFGRLLGTSAIMRRVYVILERLAASDVPLLIEGETGTGKELVAECLHESSPRRAHPFVVVDSAAVTEAGAPTELFGEESAAGIRPGPLELAHRGTLFIDEITELPMSAQSKLLRVLERGELRRAGGTSTVRIDVRLIASSRRNVDAEIQAGRFREELFHRTAITRIELPPLRRRTGDVEFLARHFLRELGGDVGQLDATTLARWKDQSWHGNVRELRHAVLRHSMNDPALPKSEASPNHDDRRTLAQWVEGALANETALPRARLEIVREFEHLYVARILARHSNNVTRAAAASGIAHRYFQLIKSRSPRT
jgi:DNA-binding NtrC family response regulator